MLTPEDEGEGSEEGPEDDVLQYEHDAYGQVLLPGLIDEEEWQQDGGDAGHNVAADAKHELAHQPQLAPVVQPLLHRLHCIRVVVWTHSASNYSDLSDAQLVIVTSSFKDTPHSHKPYMLQVIP